MKIPTEQIGSIPRPSYLVEEFEKYNKGESSLEKLNVLAEQATKETMLELENTGSDCISNGEQDKFNGFFGYCLHGLECIDPEGVAIEFEDGHIRKLPVITKGPFQHSISADQFLKKAIKLTDHPVKQSVIAPSAISLIYPQHGIEGYSRDQFIEDLIREKRKEIKDCLDLGAHKVQIDFTEGRLSIKMDPSGALLRDWVELINRTLGGFTDEERQRIGLHTCPGSDLDSKHSSEVDYKFLLPTLFKVNVGNYYIAMAGEENSTMALALIKTLMRPGIRVFIGVTDPCRGSVETPEEIRDRVLEAAKYIPLEQLGICDDCGFSPFADDCGTAREIAFGKISARVAGVKMAEQILREKIGAPLV